MAGTCVQHSLWELLSPLGHFLDMYTCASGTASGDASALEQLRHSPRLGPSSLDALTNGWPERLLAGYAHLAFVSTGENDILLGARILKQLESIPWILTEVYGGTATGGSTFRMLCECLSARGISLQVRHYSCTDIDPLCRDFQAHHRSPPEHQFGNLCDRVNSEVVIHLCAIQENFRTQADQVIAQRSEGKSQREVYSEIGDRFFEEACSFLDGVEVDPDVECWCFVHNRPCRVRPDVPPGAVWLEIGGNTCTPWTTSGKHLGYLDPASIPSLIWGYTVKSHRPVHVVNECVRLWPALQFWQRILQDTFYRIVSDLHNPYQFGFPANRCRRLTHLRDGAHPAGRARFGATSHNLLLAAGFDCNPALTADSYFQAPKRNLEKYRADLLTQRMFVLPPGIKSLSWELVIPFHFRARLKRWKKFLRLQGIDLAKSDHALVADIQHNPEWMGRASQRHMPALMRQAHPWNLKRKRPMIPLEHLLVNAFPVWAEVPPVPLEYLESLANSDVRRLAGNMMHLGTLGSFISFVVLDSVVGDHA